MRNKKQVRALVDRDDRFQVIYLGIIYGLNILKTLKII